MTDVARHAGVSQSTVSYVLSGTRSVSSKTRERVEKAIEDLGYTPRAAAQALRGDKTDTLVLSLPTVDGTNSPTIGMYVLEIARAARSAGYDLLLSTESEHPARALRTALDGRRADGGILMSLMADDPRVPVSLDSGVPIVALGRPSPDTGLPWVDFDFAAAVDLAAGELADRGRRSLVYVGPADEECEQGYLYVGRALDGFRRARQRLGLPGVETRIARHPVVHEARLREAIAAAGPDPGLIVVSPSHMSVVDAVARDLLRPSAEVTDVIVVGRAGSFIELLPGQAFIANSVSEIAERAIDAVVRTLRGEPATTGYMPMRLDHWSGPLPDPGRDLADAPD